MPIHLEKTNIAFQSPTLVSCDIQIEDQKGLRHKGLTKDHLQLSENGQVRKIITIQEVSKPLSIVIVLSLGTDAICFRDFDQFVGFLQEALTENLRPEDEVAIALTSEDGKIALKFSDGVKQRIELLGDKSNRGGTVGKLNQKTGERRVAQVYFNSSVDSQGITQIDHRQKIIIVQPKNYLHTAVANALEYLKENHKASHRQVMLFCNSIYNVAPFDFSQANKFQEEVTRNNFLVSWYGEPSQWVEDATENYVISPRMSEKEIKQLDATPWEKPNRRGRAPFVSLINLTGGVARDCDAFHPTTGSGKSRKQFLETMRNLITNLRTRYKITYESDNPDLAQPRDIKLEMSPQWKSGKVTLHYPQVIYPQTSGK